MRIFAKKNQSFIKQKTGIIDNIKISINQY